jgi:Cys-tRNA(Pro)/Cys-tRNA(Cys) deacylase
MTDARFMTDRPPKTQAMRSLDQMGVAYDLIVFPETIHDARGVADFAGLPYGQVFKTLVVRPPEPRGHPALILIPADGSLDLKKTARELKRKKLEMATRAEAERWTGLKIGGISALALLPRGFPVYLDRSAGSLGWLVVSAGKRGLNLRLRVEDFRRVTGASWVDAARPEAETGATGGAGAGV